MSSSSEKDFASSLFGDTLITQEGEQSPTEALKGKQFVGVYFSAHWCPPCRGFTPLLAAFYDSLAEEDADALEVVFVSSDQTEADFRSYFKTMPWTALPLTSRHKAELSNKYGVSGIPMLVILDGVTGEVKSANGRGDVSANKTAPAKCLAQWKSNAVVEDMGGSWCNIL
mmetsp:Transcript_17064/g.28496  ORF Transcript_17064/g.28496 Transcript_17064/m.28496 type:complete len:170 (+) Transcript_17064:66-575(+)